jgi:hypothetical protein
VCEDVLQRDLAVGRNEMHTGAARIVWKVPHGDARILELRDVFRNRIVQHQLSFFHQHQDGDSGDRLGHGGHAEQRVRAHRLLGIEILIAAGFEVDHFAFAIDQRHGA